MNGTRFVAAAAAVTAFLAAIALVGYGLLYLAAIPSSDSATSALVLVGGVLVALGIAAAGLGWVAARRAAAPRESRDRSV